MRRTLPGDYRTAIGPRLELPRTPGCLWICPCNRRRSALSVIVPCIHRDGCADAKSLVPQGVRLTMQKCRSDGKLKFRSVTLRECGTEENCRRIEASVCRWRAAERAATDSTMPLNPSKRSRRVAGMSLAESATRHDGDGPVSNEPASQRRRLQRGCVQRAVSDARFCSSTARCPPVSPRRGHALSTERPVRQPLSSFGTALRRGWCLG